MNLGDAVIYKKKPVVIEGIHMFNGQKHEFLIRINGKIIVVKPEELTPNES